MTAVTIPSVGIAMEEALVVRWLKQPGDEVAVDEPVVEIETDKATMDVVSPVAGRLGPHLFEAGAVVPVGVAIVHVLDGEDEAPADPDSAVAAGASSEPASELQSEPQSEPQPGERTAHRLSPRARRLALEQLQEAPAATPEAPSGAPPDTPSAAPPAGRFRELIASKVAESWREIPHFAVTREVDAGAMLAALAAIRSEGFDPAATLTDLLLRSLALALAAGGDGGPVDVGLAVATDEGVVIPVVRDVLALAPAELACARSAAVARARDGRLSPDDLSAAPSSTLSNLGAFGVDAFTGIIAHGQTSLLTVGRVQQRPVVDRQGAITVGSRLQATLNADHRTVDGADAARVLGAFAEAAESMTPDSWERSA